MWLVGIFLNVLVSTNWTGPPLKDLVLSPVLVMTQEHEGGAQHNGGEGA
jgi:hypothetical protein